LYGRSSEKARARPKVTANDVPRAAQNPFVSSCWGKSAG
jgi:hypothetical protein